MSEREAIEAQATACAAARMPHFAPSDGVCWGCGRFIYRIDGIPNGAEPTSPVTGCPYCHKSFCD